MKFKSEKIFENSKILPFSICLHNYIRYSSPNSEERLSNIHIPSGFLSERSFWKGEIVIRFLKLESACNKKIFNEIVLRCLIESFELDELTDWTSCMTFAESAGEIFKKKTDLDFAKALVFSKMNTIKIRYNIFIKKFINTDFLSDTRVPDIVTNRVKQIDEMISSFKFLTANSDINIEFVNWWLLHAEKSCMFWYAALKRVEILLDFLLDNELGLSTLFTGRISDFWLVSVGRADAGSIWFLKEKIFEWAPILERKWNRLTLNSAMLLCIESPVSEWERSDYKTPSCEELYLSRIFDKSRKFNLGVVMFKKLDALAADYEDFKKRFNAINFVNDQRVVFAIDNILTNIAKFKENFSNFAHNEDCSYRLRLCTDFVLAETFWRDHRVILKRINFLFSFCRYHY
jgi:hypothetical protein